MLPLEPNDLANEDDWHHLKTALVVCRYSGLGEARAAYDRLPSHLKSHCFGDVIRSFLDSHDAKLLDSAAAELTQRPLPEAWLQLERL